MSSIDLVAVRKVAKLARLDFEPEEEARLAGELERIVDFVRVLDELDIPSEAPAFAEPVVLRADEVMNVGRVEEMLATAPDRQGDHLRVPAVMKDKGGD